MPCLRIPSRVSSVRFSPREQVDDPQALTVVIEAAVTTHAIRQHPLARVTERGVAEVVRERDRLREVLVEPQRARNGAGDLTPLECVGEAVPVVIALVVDEDLGLVLQPPEGARVDDAVTVALEGRAIGMIGLGVNSPLGFPTAHGVRCQSYRLVGLDGAPVLDPLHGRPNASRSASPSTCSRRSREASPISSSGGSPGSRKPGRPPETSR